MIRPLACCGRCTYTKLREEFEKNLLLRERDGVVRTYYNPFYEMWKAAKAEESEKEYPTSVAWDFAKPDSERTVAWSNVSDPAVWQPEVDPVFANAAVQEEVSEQKRNEHIWDMIVLAAKSSRGE